MQALKMIALGLLKIARALLADDQVVAMIARDNVKLAKKAKSATTANKAAMVLKHVAETGTVVAKYSEATATVAEQGLTVVRNGVALRDVATAAAKLLDAWAERRETPLVARRTVGEGRQE